jgi:release factor glutamine methyltransferase
MKFKQTKIHIRTQLQHKYPENEIEAFIRLMFEEILNVPFTKLISEENQKISQEDLVNLEKVISRLKNEEPIQYIIGHTEFYGLKIRVSPAVLIPRPETEELVDWIIRKTRPKKQPCILDLGTGSGCIALALAKNIHASNVYAIDKSKKALETGINNALENNLQITFIQGDILSEIPELSNLKFDIIVSNPPYVCESEKAMMNKNVTAFEPEIALFVKDHHPLIFYERICEWSKTRLKEGGCLFVEINEKFGKEVMALFSENNLKEIEIRNDINGKERFVFGKK